MQKHKWRFIGLWDVTISDPPKSLSLILRCSRCYTFAWGTEITQMNKMECIGRTNDNPPRI